MTLAAYTIGLVPFVLIRSVVAPFLARGDTLTPVKAALTGTAVNIAFKIALMGSLSQVGLALATAIGAWINFILVLWFAGRAGNWPLADYEMGELNEGFEDVTKLLGGDTVDKAVGAPMQALQKIIDNKDRADFTAAFDQLTAGCNSCHRTLDHGFIAIQRPTSLPYSNQNFAPQK